jgi:hypothetical protein
MSLRDWSPAFQDFKTLFFVDLTALADEPTALYRDIGNQIPGDAASRPRRTDVSFTPLREPKNSHTVGTVHGVGNV